MRYNTLIENLEAIIYNWYEKEDLKLIIKYPVSGLQEWNRCYYNDKNLWWTGEQLELRMSLLEHIKCEVLKLTNEEFEEMFK